MGGRRRVVDGYEMCSGDLLGDRGLDFHKEIFDPMAALEDFKGTTPHVAHQLACVTGVLLGLGGGFLFANVLALELELSPNGFGGGVIDARQLGSLEEMRGRRTVLMDCFSSTTALRNSSLIDCVIFKYLRCASLGSNFFISLSTYCLMSSKIFMANFQN